MNFISLAFLAFLAVTIAVYFLVPLKVRWIVLAAASALFYLWAGWESFLFLLAVAAATYGAGALIGRVDKKTEAWLAADPEIAKERRRERRKRDAKKKKAICAAAVVLCIGALAAVKYLGLLLDTAGRLAQLFGLQAFSVTVAFLVPVGHSFYLFQGVGYVVDVYRGICPAERNPLKYFLFLAYFPHLLQGPIERYNDLAPQLLQGHRWDTEGAKEGVRRILIGFLKKVALADVLAVCTGNILQSYAAEGAMVFLLLILYAVQLYADFSGFMDIALGVSRIFGIRLQENFDKPYLSRSIAEFWRRWHITLGSWFRDYVYYPVIGSKLGHALAKRKSKRANVLLTVLALLAVWCCMGLWHGADWTYLIYGLYHGGLIILSVLAEPLCKKCRAALHIDADAFLYRAFCVARTFLLVCLGYVFFIAGNISTAWSMLTALFTSFDLQVLWNGTLADVGLSAFTFLQAALVVVLLFLAGNVFVPRRRRCLYTRRETALYENVVTVGLLYCAALAWILLYSAGDYTSMFVYFQF